MPKPKFRREDLKPDEVLCSYCTGKCCRYFALPIETPTTWDDFDHIRWYMFHGHVSIFVEDETWYLMVFADCEHLQEDNRCGILSRPPFNLPVLHHGKLRIRQRCLLRQTVRVGRPNLGIRRSRAASQKTRPREPKPTIACPLVNSFSTQRPPKEHAKIVCLYGNPRNLR